MNFKKIGYLVIISLLAGFMVVPAVMAQDNLVDPDIPDSWYEDPQTASEMGISNFSQSPLLDERVDKGELAPVDQRLPDDPPVIEPYQDIGQYGGTLDFWSSHLSYFPSTERINAFANLGRATPDAKKEIPYIAKGWEYSDDYKTLILHLREGLKWSDGNDFNAEDYMYWWEYVAHNEDLNPVPPEKWTPNPLLDVKSPDPYTVKFQYKNPDPTRHQEFHNWCWWGIQQPSHYMKQFHPAFVDKEKLEEQAQEVGLDTWYEYYNRVIGSLDHPEYEHVRPSLRPYISTKRTETTLIGERNPYFPFVDPEGNQLPYIDKLRVNLAQSREMANTKAATGEADLAATYISIQDMPLYMKNQDKGNFRVFQYSGTAGAVGGININLTVKDTDLRNIFQNVKFRKALSLSINRKEINEKVYYGKAVPRQTTVVPTSKYFEPEFAEAYIDFNPEKAQELLDEINLKDQDGDGLRELPNGETFNPTLIFVEGQVPYGRILELLVTKWDNVGLDIDLKQISRELYMTRTDANNWQLSIWQVNRTHDLLFPRAPTGGALTPATFESSGKSFSQYGTWYTSGGEEGMEPPTNIKKLIDFTEQLRFGLNENKRIEGAKKLLASQAENLWNVGTVGLPPKPVIASNELRNIPEKGFYAPGLFALRPYYPSQFYLEE